MLTWSLSSESCPDSVCTSLLVDSSCVCRFRSSFCSPSPSSAARDMARIEIAHSLPRIVDPELTEPTTWTIEYRLPLDVLEKYGLEAQMMVDFSHANSMKDFNRQVDVCNNVAAQISDGEKRIMGVMIESHLVEGRQDVIAGQPLTYGQSITDACISWETTEVCLRDLADAVRKRRDINAQQVSA